MGDHIVRRGPPTRPPQPTRPQQPRERRPTAEIPQHQLHALIHHPTQDELEADLELVDAFPGVLPDGTPDSLPSLSSPRLAHTRRRAMRPGTVPIMPAPPERDVSAVAIPRAQPPALPEAELPSTERPTLPAIPRHTPPALASPKAEPHPVMGHQALPPIDATPNEPPFVATMRRPLLPSGARVVVLLALAVLALGAAAFWLA